MKSLFFSLLLILSFFLLNCNNSDRYINYDFIEFEENGLIANNEYLFSPFKKEKTQKDSTTFTASIIVRYNDSCEILDIPLQIEYPDYNSSEYVQLNKVVPLFSKSGKALGKGNFGFYEIIIPFLYNLRYSELFFVSVKTTEKHNNGIVSLGIILTPEIK